MKNSETGNKLKVPKTRIKVMEYLMNPINALKSHLGAQFTLLFLLLTVLPMLGVGILAFTTSQPALEQDVINRLTTITLLKESEVNRWIKNNQELLSVIAQRPLVREHINELNALEKQTDPAFITLRESLLDDHLLPSVVGSSGFRDLILLRASDGLILVSNDESLEGKYRESEEFFIQGKMGTHVQQPVYDLAHGEGVMHISTPVKDSRGQVVAVLAGHSNLAELSEIMRQRSGISQSEESYLVNISNLLITESRFISGSALVNSIFTEGVSNCLKGIGGSGFYDDYRGVPVVGVYRWMADLEMCIITEEDQAEAFSTIDGLTSAILPASGLAVFISLMLGIIMTRSITQPLSQLVDSSVEIGSGNLNHRIEVKGSDEISHLAQSFNQMAASLQLITASRDELNKEIAERRKAEMELSIKDFAFESSSSADSISSNDGFLTYANPSFARLWGYENVDEVIGKSILDFLADSDDALEIIESLTNTGKWSGEYKALRKDGSTFIALSHANAVIDNEGNQTALYSSVVDITERKRTEEEISRFSRIFEDSLNEIFLFDPDSLKFTQVNSAGQKNLGYTMEELSELTPLDIKPEVTADSFEYLINPLRENKTDRVVFETVHQRKDGSLYHVEVHLQLLRYEEDSLFTAFILDITERYNAELENKRYIRRLDALLNIDQAIMGSFDLQVTLNVILEHLITQLAIDAVAVLSYHPDLQTLSFTQGRGFQTPALQYTDLRLGEGFAGEVGVKRDYIYIPDLNQAEGKFQESPLFSQEGFVSYYGIPLLAKGKLVGVLEIFNRSPLDPEEEWVNYLRLLAGQIAIAIDNISLFNDLQRSNVDLTLSYDATIEGWARALELKDMETEGHSRRVVDMTLIMARNMEISGELLGHIRRGALLHDIGKMGIPDSILQKPEKLNDEEWQIMKQHPVFAQEWLSQIGYLRPALDIPYAHHERWDGKGYPRGLEGEQIPLAARIFAIVDVWDALNSDRPYRKAWTKEKILDHIREQSGKHFDPKVVETFIEIVTEG